MRMLELIATLTHFAILIQDAIHRPPRAQVFSFVHQCGIHFTWSLILKAITVQQLADFSLLCGKQSTWGGQRFRDWAWIGCRSHSIETAPGNIQCLAGPQHTDRFGQLLGGLDHLRSSRLFSSTASPSICATFFWTSIINSACPSLSCKPSFSRRSLASSI